MTPLPEPCFAVGFADSCYRLGIAGTAGRLNDKPSPTSALVRGSSAAGGRCWVQTNVS